MSGKEMSHMRMTSSERKMKKEIMCRKKEFIEDRNLKLMKVKTGQIQKN